MSLENEVSSIEDDEEFVDELKPNTQLMHGQYTIEAFLAAGGFGITYLARDSLNRRVVVKECFPGNFCRRQNASVMPRSRAHQSELSSIVRLFSQEAMSLAKAKHPNIVGVHQVFEENNTAYMALDFVQGRDLLEILKEDAGSLTPPVVEGYLIKVLGAIQHIHNMGMLHRDISPDNIIINEAGEPILIDFGAAREEASDERVTRMLSALRVVKDGYSPQEFYIAGSKQSPSCDLYSLAASFYHVITGELPPDSQRRLSARAANDADPYVSLGEKVSGYSKNFVTGLDKAISILPPDRMQSAAEWLDHIQNKAPVTPKKPIAKAKPAPKAQAKKPMVPMLVGAGALAAAGVGLFMMTGTDTAVKPDTQTAAIETAANAEVPAPAPAAAPAEIATVATNIEVPPTPSASLDTSSGAPATELDAPQSQSGADLGIATAGDTPKVDTAGPSKQVQANSSAVDFFVSMQTSEPALAATSSPRTSSGASQSTQPIAQTAPVANTGEVTSSVTRLLPLPPFMLSNAEPGLIVAVAVNAPSWLEENARIVSIDGQSVATNDEINERLAAVASTVEAGSFEANIGFENQDGSTTERALSIPVERQTLLVNGLKFVTRENNSNWTTQVVEAPAASNFKVGDTLVSFTSTWEEVNGPNSLQSILERELANGTSSFSFAVRRDGEIWVEVFDLAS